MQLMLLVIIPKYHGVKKYMHINNVFEKVSDCNAADAVGDYTKISRGKKSIYILTNKELEMFSFIATAIDR